MWRCHDRGRSAPVVTLMVLIASGKLKVHLAAITALIVANIITRDQALRDLVDHDRCDARHRRAHEALSVEAAPGFSCR